MGRTTPTAKKEAGSRRTTQNIKTIRNNMFLYSYFSHDSVVPKLDAPAICKGVVPSIWPLQFLTSLWGPIPLMVASRSPGTALRVEPENVRPIIRLQMDQALFNLGGGPATNVIPEYQVNRSKTHRILDHSAGVPAVKIRRFQAERLQVGAQSVCCRYSGCSPGMRQSAKGSTAEMFFYHAKVRYFKVAISS